MGSPFDGGHPLMGPYVRALVGWPIVYQLMVSDNSLVSYGRCCLPTGESPVVITIRRPRARHPEYVGEWMFQSDAMP